MSSTSTSRKQPNCPRPSLRPIGIAAGATISNLPRSNISPRAAAHGQRKRPLPHARADRNPGTDRRLRAVDAGRVPGRNVARRPSAERAPRRSTGTHGHGHGPLGRDGHAAADAPARQEASADRTGQLGRTDGPRVGLPLLGEVHLRSSVHTFRNLVVRAVRNDRRLCHQVHAPRSGLQPLLHVLRHLHDGHGR